VSQRESQALGGLEDSWDKYVRISVFSVYYGTRSADSIKSNCSIIHSSIVQNYLSNRKPNPIINQVPPPVSKSELSLPRNTTRLLCQLRSGQSKFLFSYLNREFPNDYPSALCPACKLQEHNVSHLVNCPIVPNPLNLSPLDSPDRSWGGTFRVASFPTPPRLMSGLVRCTWRARRANQQQQGQLVESHWTSKHHRPGHVTSSLKTGIINEMHTSLGKFKSVSTSVYSTNTTWFRLYSIRLDSVFVQLNSIVVLKAI